MRALNALLSVYTPQLQFRILEDQLAKFQAENNDKGVNILSSVFYKAVFKRSKAEGNETETRCILEHARDTWLP